MNNQKTSFLLSTLNCDGSWYGMEMQSWLGRVQPDILIVQEAAKPNGFSEQWFKTTKHIADVKINGKPLYPDAPVFEKGYSIRLMDTTVDFGQAIWARAGVELSAVNVLPIEEAIDDYTEASGWTPTARLFHAVARVDGHDINLLTYHGRLPTDKGRLLRDETGAPYRNGHPTTTMVDFQKIAGYITQLKSPTVLAGDFNVFPRSAALQPLESRMRSVWSDSFARRAGIRMGRFAQWLERERMVAEKSNNWPRGLGAVVQGLEGALRVMPVPTTRTRYFPFGAQVHDHILFNDLHLDGFWVTPEPGFLTPPLPKLPSGMPQALQDAANCLRPALLSDHRPLTARFRF